MSKIYEALKQAEQERAAQRNVGHGPVPRGAGGDEGVDAALGECRAQLAELWGRVETVEAESGRASQQIDRTAENLALTLATIQDRLDHVSRHLDAGVQKAHEEVEHLHRRLRATTEDWNERLVRPVDEARAALERNAPAVDEVRQDLARLQQQQTQSHDQLHGLLGSVRLQASRATQRVDALDARLQTHDELLRGVEEARLAIEAVLGTVDSRVRDLAEQSHASAIEHEKLRSGFRDATNDLAAEVRHVALDNEHRLQEVQRELATVRQSTASTASTTAAHHAEQQKRTETAFQQLAARVASSEWQAAEQLSKTLEVAAQLAAWSSKQDRAAARAEHLFAEVEGLRAQATESQASIGALAQQLSQLRTAVAGQGQATDELKAALEPLREQLSNWSVLQERRADRVEQLRTEVESLRAGAARSDGSIAALDQQLAELRNTVAAGQAQTAEALKAALEPLAAQQSNWDAAHEQGAERVDHLRTEVKTLRTEAAEWSARAGSLERAIAELQAGVGSSLERVAAYDAIRVAEQRQRDEEIAELHRALQGVEQRALETSSRERRTAEVLSAEVKQIAEGAGRDAAALTSVRERVDALGAALQSLQLVVNAQSRDVAEAIDVHRTCDRDTAAAHRSSILTPREGVEAPGRDTATLSPARDLPVEVPTVLRSERERGTGRFAGIVPNYGRRLVPMVVVACGLVFGAMALWRAPSVTTRRSDRADAGGEATSPSLRDPRAALRVTGGLTALRNGDFAAAEKAFREVVAICPQCTEARNNLAVALDRAGKREAAVEQLHEALRIRPDYARASENLERLQGGLGAPSEDPEGWEAR